MSQNDTLFFKSWCEPETYEEALNKGDRFCSVYENSLFVKIRVKDNDNKFESPSVNAC